MVSDGGRGGNTTKEIGLSPPVHSEAIGNWPSSTAGTDASARVVAGDEDEPEVTGVSLPWAEVGHSEGTVTVAAGMLSGTPDSSVRAWTTRALARETSRRLQNPWSGWMGWRIHFPGGP